MFLNVLKIKVALNLTNNDPGKEMETLDHPFKVAHENFLNNPT